MREDIAQVGAHDHRVGLRGVAQGCLRGLSRGPYAAFAPPDAAMKNAWQNGDACITLAASQRKQQ
ncbi:hypothetical protein [Cupriavidus sp. WS]|uniref:hypothetical protein n=1 Tax=Cupriavidus sp. WS TaxID=1312922 RepID=UPI0012DC4621|nr:hypothetical protein [Cupriavidus sp. WS]